MKHTTGLLAILLSSCLIFACGGSKKDDKKGEDDKADKDKADEDKSDDKKDKDEGGTADKGKIKAPGSFSALLSGKSSKKRTDTMKKTGLGLGSILGGMGAGGGPMAASGDMEAKKAPVAKPVDHRDHGEADTDDGPPPMEPVEGASAKDCDKVANHLMKLAMAEATADIPPEYKDQMESMLEDAKKEIAALCATQFTDEVKQCVLSAKAIEDMDKCEELFNAAGGQYGGDDDYYDEDYDEDYDYDDPMAKPVGDPPKWDGKDSSCSAVGVHMGKLLVWLYSGEEGGAEMASMVDEMVPQFVDMCDQGAWPEKARMCILKAQSEEDMETCGEMIGM